MAGGGILLVAVLLVALLPTILVHTPLLGFFVRRAARLDSLAFQSASLGWLSPTSITGIVIRDAQGETVLEADRLTIDRSLPRLIFNSTNLGTMRIEKPRLTAKLENTKAGEPYTISVAPADTTQKESAEISVQTDFPADAPRAYTIHARIK